MKKNDWILAAVILLVAGVGFFIYANFVNQAVGFVNVIVDGELYGTYSLKEDSEIQIFDTNYMIIKDECVDIVKADCPDQICVEHKRISKNQETIVCLPNKVVVKIVGGEEAELDAVAN